MSTNGKTLIFRAAKLKGFTVIFRENVLDLRPKSFCAVEMTMYVHWTCVSI